MKKKIFKQCTEGIWRCSVFRQFFFSHRRILSKYCGVKDKRCFASIQHGSFTLNKRGK